MTYEAVSNVLAAGIGVMARPKDPQLRDRLLRCAAHEFSVAGFAGASMAGIGEAAGVTKGGVYFHFRSKEELFFAVLDRWSHDLREVLRAEPSEPAGASAASQLSGFLAAFLDFHFRRPHEAGLLAVLAGEMQGRFTTQVREDLGGAARGLRAKIRELLSSGSADGSLFADDPALAAFLLAAAIEGIVHQWLASPVDIEPFCVAESLADGLVRPYLGAGGPPRPEDRGFQPF